MANQSTDPGMTSGAKVGIAIAAAFGIVSLFSLGLWVWWRRRQKLKMARNMVNFVDGDIVNLVDRGRFEKPSKPNDAYDPYYETGSSSQSFHPTPQYFQAPATYTVPPADPLTEYHAPLSTSPSFPASQDWPAPPEAPRVAAPLPASTTDHHAWANLGRHPWSPPDYDAHTPVSASSLQADQDFHAQPRQSHPVSSGNSPVAYPVALPAILPEPKPQPQAELPAREGHHGWGHEQELPAPQQAPLRRQPPPQGADIDEQKFLLADIIAIREQKSRPNMAGPAG